jgi:hypothetical protein
MLEAVEAFHKFLDGVRLGSILTIVGVIMVMYAYFTGTIDIDEAFKYFGFVSGGSAAVGFMRTYSGKGI